MSTGTAGSARRRRDVLDALRRVGREHSDATVIFHTAVAERLGLHATDSKTMSLLERRGRLSAGEIAQSTGLTTAAVTALIDRLERRGLVQRTPDPSDRRRVMVEPTPDGIARFAPFFEAPRRSLARLYAPYATDELAIILDFLTRSAERLRAETRQLPQTSEHRIKETFDGRVSSSD
ncbi:MAG: MarR family winged helix-turn-helix transcriptional regulator [Acidimicrobiales bacterium]